MSHELSKLDAFLNLPDGASYEVIVRHGAPTLLNARLFPYGVQLDGDGMLDKSQRPAWKALMQRAGIGKRYWKDPDLLLKEAAVADL